MRPPSSSMHGSGRLINAHAQPVMVASSSPLSSSTRNSGGAVRAFRRLMRRSHGGHLGGAQITDNDVRRLARKGGVKRIAKATIAEARHALVEYMKAVLKDTVVYTEHARRMTVTVPDVLRALRKRGTTLYGYGGDELPTGVKSRHRRAETIRTAPVNVQDVLNAARTGQAHTAAATVPPPAAQSPQSPPIVEAARATSPASAPDSSAAALTTPAPTARVLGATPDTVPNDAVTPEDVTLAQSSFAKHFQEAHVDDCPASHLFARARAESRAVGRTVLSEATLRGLLAQLQEQNRVMVDTDTDRVFLI